ncbi:hypothetical protein N7450_006084 [Penicillium hetheringtonii]|uniref:Uncharacterized protein n=1 Tax=Penicillium hetheringtonii TaxID=911720 RepID=A0AAD6GSY0_9EURO|nr:hypothetical protein N7450_006084 [Penicillium hetheringtonii]
MAYPTTTAPDPRIGMEPRYTPDYERSRPQPAREREPHRRRNYADSLSYARLPFPCHCRPME